jgi:hypothetical protein
MIRLAILSLPLTSAAPDGMAQALGDGGDAWGRFVGATLVAGLLVFERLSRKET